MPLPVPIADMNRAAHHCGDTQLIFDNPRGGAGGRTRITRTFKTYLELGMQSKHDEVIRGECQRIGVVGRPEAGTQFVHGPRVTAAMILAPNGFYAQRGVTAAHIARDKMIELWRLQAPGAAPVFSDHTTGNATNRYHRVDIGGQNIPRQDGNCYEASFWYEGHTLYVLFHCYPPRR